MHNVSSIHGSECINAMTWVFLNVLSYDVRLVVMFVLFVVVWLTL